MSGTLEWAGEQGDSNTSNRSFYLELSKESAKDILKAICKLNNKLSTDGIECVELSKICNMKKKEIVTDGGKKLIGLLTSKSVRNLRLPESDRDIIMTALNKAKRIKLRHMD